MAFRPGMRAMKWRVFGALLGLVATACGGTLEGEYLASQQGASGAGGVNEVGGGAYSGGADADTSGGTAAGTEGQGAVRSAGGGGGASAAGSASESGVDGGGGSGGGSGEGGGATDYGVTADTIRLGGTTVLSGPVAEYGKQGLYGFDARVQHINEAGGINGRQLELVFYNDEFDPAKGLAFFRRLVEGDEIFMSVGSSSVDAVADYVCKEVAQKQGTMLPFIGDPGLSPKSYMPDKYPCLFPTGPGFRHDAWARGQNVRDLGAKTIAQIYTNDDNLGDIDLLTKQYKEAYEANGLEVVAMEPMDAGASSCSTQIKNVKAADPDWLYLNLIPPNDLILCIQAMQAEVPAYKPPVGTELEDPLEVFIETGGEFVEGFYAQTIFKALADPNPAMREYVEDMKKYHPDVDAGGSITMSLYLAGKVNEHLLASLGGNVTRQRIIDAANSLKNWDSGMGPVISWTKDDHAGSKTNYLVQVKNGKFVHVAGPTASNCPPTVC